MENTQEVKDTREILFDITGQTMNSGQLTRRNHAVSMGGGWQAVSGRGVVHKDWQGWVYRKWGERVGAECLACHFSLGSVWMVPTVNLRWSLNCFWILGLALLCCFVWILILVLCLVFLKSFSLPSFVMSCFALFYFVLPSLVLSGLYLAASCLLSPFILLYCLLFSLAQSNIVLT